LLLRTHEYLAGDRLWGRLATAARGGVVDAGRLYLRAVVWCHARSRGLRRCPGSIAPRNRHAGSVPRPSSVTPSSTAASTGRCFSGAPRHRTCHCGVHPWRWTKEAARGPTWATAQGGGGDTRCRFAQEAAAVDLMPPRFCRWRHNNGLRSGPCGPRSGLRCLFVLLKIDFWCRLT
jgi:hypothetical protein